MKGDITLLLHAGASRSRCALHDGKQRRSVRSFSHQCIQSYALSLKRSILIPCEFNVWNLGKKPNTLLALASDHSRLIMPTGRESSPGVEVAEVVVSPGKPGLVIPIRFGVFRPKRAEKTLKRTGMTTLGSPGLSSQSVSGFSGRKGPKKPETD